MSHEPVQLAVEQHSAEVDDHVGVQRRRAGTAAERPGQVAAGQEHGWHRRVGPPVGRSELGSLAVGVDDDRVVGDWF